MSRVLGVNPLRRALTHANYLVWVTARMLGKCAQKKNGASEDAPFFSDQYQSDQVQVITPLVMSQTLAVCVWVAVALHEGGGPATPVTTTVTFCEGLKPWRGAAAVAVPEK